jgi:hypothetical protein
VDLGRLPSRESVHMRAGCDMLGEVGSIGVEWLVFCSR